VLPLILAVTTALTAAAWFLVQPLWRRRRRLAVTQRPFPEQWAQWLRERVPIYERLPEALRERLHGLIRLFVEEKRFVGCNGLVVTEQMRVIIAAYACLLVLNRPDVPRVHFYDELLSVLVYPTPFIVPHSTRDAHGVVSEGHRVLAGQAWDSRRILLSWEDIDASTHNVVLHEFAHYLDMEDETMDGAPGLGSARAYREWSTVFWSEYDRLREDLSLGRPTFLDPYAASAPEEFFAVVTEAFFQQPRELQMQHPGLYEQLRRYYRLDPATW
jgi:Mlc titration factor MtfA (ptsG expression regulator)